LELPSAAKSNFIETKNNEKIMEQKNKFDLPLTTNTVDAPNTPFLK
jgi:hypothetical protein